MKVLTPNGLRDVPRSEIWTKYCACGNFIPNEYRVCNRCVLKRAETLLAVMARYESEGLVLYEEALRAARRWEEEL